MRQLRRGGDLYKKVYGNHEKRMRQLEVDATAGGGSGIQFDIANIGGGLDVTTTGSTGINFTTDLGSNGAISLWDRSATGIYILSGDGSNPGFIGIECSDGGALLFIDSFGDIGLRVGGGVGFGAGQIKIQYDNGIDAITFSGSTGSLSSNLTGTMNIGSDGLLTLSTRDDMKLKIDTAGKSLTVFDHLGNPIFRVDEDGDLHGLTGKALTFDL